MKSIEHNTLNEATTLDRRGFAMVTTLLIVLVLSVMAIGIVWLATSEKKTTFAEGVHMRSVFAADAGGEAGINYLRMLNSPPRIINWATKSVRSQGETNIVGSQTYGYECEWGGMDGGLGWDTEMVYFLYNIRSEGKASTEGESDVALIAGRLFKKEY